MNRILTLIKIVTLVLFTCCGCSTLRSGKSYIVEDVKGSGYVIKLRGLDELFTVPGNKLRIGDTIKVFRTFKENKATIY